jgi:hypothetical protein
MPLSDDPVPQRGIVRVHPLPLPRLLLGLRLDPGCFDVAPLFLVEGEPAGSGEMMTGQPRKGQSAVKNCTTWPVAGVRCGDSFGVGVVFQ